MTSYTTSSSFSAGDIVAVLVPLAAGSPFDYRVPDGMEVLRTGDLVQVPLSSRMVMGVVTGAGTLTTSSKKMRDIAARHEGASLSPETLDFLFWMAGYVMADPGAVLKLAMPVDLVAEGLKVKKRATKPRPIGGTSPDLACAALPLTPDQRAAADVLCGGTSGVFVLDGVTGSGKTEVYFEAVAAALARGVQVLILQPEIALTGTFCERFTRRFGQAPALWHSGLTPAMRRDTLKGILSGEVRAVAGARSALMLPYPNLGLIVVDEEHDASYKQEDGVIYHARDMAVARGTRGNFPVILASATPSLETVINTESGKYQTLRLPSRYGDAQMPEINVIDMKADIPEKGCFLSPRLVREMTDVLAAQQQVLLFLNRRGYAPLTLCRSCGHRFMCTRCSAWMVAHRRTGRLHCHHCGNEQILPARCPSCGEEGSFAACGPGVERIEEEVKNRFPLARTLVLASDLFDHPAALSQALHQIENHEVDVVIGTQMIAKGHHFPMMTLVGVVDADLGLAGGDLRAGERTFQLLEQVSGRAGRAAHAGRVFLQTYMPGHPVMQALCAGARDRFLTIEAAQRQQAGMPPYTRLVGIVVSGRNEGQTHEVAKQLARAAPKVTGVTVWGPAEAPLYRLRGAYRFRLLVQAPRTISVQKIMAAWRAGIKIPSGIDVKIDIDPQSFL